MSTEVKNMALVCRFLEAQSKGDLEAQDELLAPDFVDHDLLPGHDPGREGFMQGIAEAHDALSSIRSTIEYQGTDDMVITRHTTRTILDRGAYLALMAPTSQERGWLGSSRRNSETHGSVERHWARMPRPDAARPNRAGLRRMGDRQVASPIPLQAPIHKTLYENHSLAVYTLALLGTTISVLLSRAPLIPPRGSAPRLLYSYRAGPMPLLGVSYVRHGHKPNEHDTNRWSTF
jgi:ketosteroid isomerase-like protein